MPVDPMDETPNSGDAAAGWRIVFGVAHPDDVIEVDEIISRDLEAIFPDE